MGNPRHEFGTRAEQAAARWLEGTGWRILERRWRCPTGELDLVCVDRGRRLVGVEVRLRRSARAGSPLESLTVRHRARLRASLVSYAIERGVPHAGLRIDLVAVTPVANGWRLVRHAGVDAW